MATRMASEGASQRPPSADVLPEIELVVLTDLKPHARNDGWHPPEEIAHLRQSIREHGIDKPVVIAVDGTLLTGHGVVKAAEAEGLTHVPAIRKPYGPEHPLALRRLVGDNHIARLRVVEDEAVAGLLAALVAEDPVALLGTGLTDAAVEAVEARLAAAEEGGGAGPARGGGRKAARAKRRERWRVIVDCDDAAQQAALLGRLQAQGYTCWGTEGEG